MKPFEVEHVREFGDGTCLLRAVKIKPGFTTGDLIDYVLTRKGDNGAIYPADPHPEQVAQYRDGKLTSTFIIPEKPIKSLEIYGGYHRWDYIFKV